MKLLHRRYWKSSCFSTSLSYIRIFGWPQKIVLGLVRYYLCVDTSFFNQSEAFQGFAWFICPWSTLQQNLFAFVRVQKWGTGKVTTKSNTLIMRVANRGLGWCWAFFFPFRFVAELRDICIVHQILTSSIEMFFVYLGDSIHVTFDGWKGAFDYWCLVQVPSFL